MYHEYVNAYVGGGSALWIVPCSCSRVSFTSEGGKSSDTYSSYCIRDSITAYEPTYAISLFAQSTDCHNCFLSYGFWVAIDLVTSWMRQRCGLAKREIRRGRINGRLLLLERRVPATFANWGTRATVNHRSTTFRGLETSFVSCILEWKCLWPILVWGTGRGGFNDSRPFRLEIQKIHH